MESIFSDSGQLLPVEAVQSFIPTSRNNFHGQKCFLKKLEKMVSNGGWEITL